MNVLPSKYFARTVSNFKEIVKGRLILLNVAFKITVNLEYLISTDQLMIISNFSEFYIRNLQIIQKKTSF